jgi:hypothetical protein
MANPTPTREGLPELPEAAETEQRIVAGTPFIVKRYTAAQMHQFREEGIAAYIASQRRQGGEVDMSAEAYLAALPRPQPECETCSGRGEIGGWRHGEGYDSEPCPDCTPPPPSDAPKPATYEDFIRLATDPDRKTPPSDAAQGDAKGEMFGTMDCADFEADTITFTMEPGYYAAAGRYRIVPAAHKGEGNGCD